jgi:cell division protein FtsB
MATCWQTVEEAALTLGISSRTLHRRLAKGEFQTRLENGRREVLVVVDDSQPLSDAAVSAQVRAELSAFARRASQLHERARSAENLKSENSPDPRGSALRATSRGVARNGAADSGDPPAIDPADQHPDFSEASNAPDTQASSPASDTADTPNEIESTMLTLHEDRIRRTDLAIMAYQQSVNVVASDSRRAHRSARIAWALAGCIIVALFVGGIWGTHTLTQAQAEVDHLHQIVRQLSDTSDARAHEVAQLRQQSETARLASSRTEGELSAAREQISQMSAALAAEQKSPDKPNVSPSDTKPSNLSIKPSAPASQPAARGAIDSVMQRLTLR